MKCKRAKQAIALYAGRDLDSVTEQELRRHLTSCPNCHDQWDRLRSSTAILQQTAAEEPEVPEPRLWSSVSRSIQALPERKPARPQSFSLSTAAVPLVAVASLLLAIVSITHSLKNPPVTGARSSLQPDPERIMPADWKPMLPRERPPVEPPPESTIRRMQEQQRFQNAPSEKKRDYTLPGGAYDRGE